MMSVDSCLKHIFRVENVTYMWTEVIFQSLPQDDLHRFLHVIIYVGGNDASSRTDTEYFEEKYEQLLVHIKENSQCRIQLANSCPRGDVDTAEVNEVYSV